MSSTELLLSVEAPAAAAPEPGSRSARVGWSLARIEGRRFLRHPLFVICVAVALIGLALYLASVAGGNTRDDNVWFFDFGILVFIPFTMMRSMMAALSERRDGVKELFDSLPAPGLARTRAHLASVLWPMGVAAILLAVVAAFDWAWQAKGATDLILLAQVLLNVGLLGAFGVLLARVVPSLAPAAWHLLYVAGLVAVVCSAASCGTGSGGDR